MSESVIIPKGATREEIYQSLIPQVRALLEGEDDLIANLANFSAVLMEAFQWHWVGFYLNSGGELVLGPFQGPVACTRIAMGKGVCGAAAAECKTYIVPNVHEFPGHIACSANSNSEIVIPYLRNGKTKFVLDIDSVKLNDFSESDEKYLTELLALIKN